VTWKVYDFGDVDQATGQALYLGEVEAPDIETAKAQAREEYPTATIPYIFVEGDDTLKGFA